MEDVLSHVYANYGLSHEEISTGQLLSRKHAHELRQQQILSQYYLSKEWAPLMKRKRNGFFIRGVNERGLRCYLTAVKQGTRLADHHSLFYAATREDNDIRTLHGTAFNAVDGFFFARDVQADDEPLREPKYILNRDNNSGSYAEPEEEVDIVEPDVFGKLLLTYNRCDKHAIPRSIGLQYVLDGTEATHFASGFWQDAAQLSGIV